jgi:hypothetical protein
VPPPRRHLVRYHGILAPHSKQREKVVPATSEEELSAGTPTTTRRNSRLTWAMLLARTFGLKLERCSLCGAEMKVVAVVTDPSSIRRYLEGTGQSAAIPEIAPARAPPQEEFEYQNS